MSALVLVTLLIGAAVAAPAPASAAKGGGGKPGGGGGGGGTAPPPPPSVISLGSGDGASVTYDATTGLYGAVFAANTPRLVRFRADGTKVSDTSHTFWGDLKESRVVHRSGEFLTALRYDGGVYAATVDGASGSWGNYELWNTHATSGIGLATSSAGTILAVAGRVTEGPTFGIGYADLDAERSVRALIPISGAVGDPYTVVDVASNGTNHLVVWEQTSALGYDVYGAFISNGLAGPVFPISDTSEPAFDPAVAWNGSSYTVVWSTWDGTERQMMATEVTGVAPPAPARRLTTGGETKRDITIAHDGTGLVLAWLEGGNNFGPAGLYRARMKADGSLVTPTLLDDSTTERPSIAAGPVGTSAIVSVRGYATVEARVA